MQTQSTPDAIQPVACLMLHKHTTQNFMATLNGRNGQNNLIATRHPVDMTPHGPMIGAGNLMTEADKDELLALLLNEAQARPDVFLDENSLVVSNRRMIWYKPPVKRKMYFSARNGAHNHTVEVMWPGLVFKVEIGGKFSIAAFAGKRRPTPATKLLHAPLQNIWMSTQVCVGSADVPKKDELNPASIPTWEAVIYDTNFSHINHENVLASGASDSKIVKFWKEKAKTGKGVLASEMTPLGKTLNQWVAG